MLSVTERKGILIAVDVLVAAVSGVAAYYLTKVFIARPDGDLIPQVWSISLLAVVTLCAAYLNELPDSGTAQMRQVFWFRWLQAWGAAMFLFAVVFLLLGSEWASQDRWKIGITRASPLIFSFIILGFLPFGRSIARHTLQLDHNRRRCVVIGAGKSAVEFLHLLSSRSSPWEVVGLVDDDPQKQNGTFGGLRVLAPIRDLPRLSAESGVADLILAVNSPLRSDSLDAIMQCFERGAAILPVADAVERMFGRVPIHCLGSKWLPSTFWATSDAPLIQRAIKRVTDLMAAVALLVLLAPIYVLLLPFAWLVQGYPLFYRQQRVGQAGRLFTLVKLRSMRTDAEKDGAKWSDKNDSRITPLGRWLRKTRLDEIPQLWNVLKGEMSLVGPRPERPEFVSVLEREIPFYRARLAAKPGLTGWAQTKLGYTNNVKDARTKLEYDLYYIKNRSLWLDLLILFRTIRTVITHQGQ
jgi:exopolysaccharide biosynthesis polyprenyl glycosylphosphotransferase